MTKNNKGKKRARRSRRGNGSKQGNSATVNEGTQTSGGLGPSRLDSAQTRQDGPTQQSTQSAPEIKASESNRIENSTKTSSLLLQRVRIMAPHVRSPSPPQKIPWTDQLNGSFSTF